MKIPENVIEFLKQSSETVGNYNNDMFSVNTYFESIELVGGGVGKISPIEQIIYIAIKAMFEVCGSRYSEPTYNNKGEDVVLCGYEIQPQAKIGKYRVDFLVSHYVCGVKSSVVVECDGHDFHDQDARQRSYEKARDRYIQSKGLTVFHYTGSDIVKNPYGIAAEIVSFLCDESSDDILGQFENFQVDQ